MAVASRDQAGDLLKEYSYLNDKFTYEFVDPEEKPAIARQYEIRDYGALVFTVGSKKQQVFGLGEQDFTGAILNVTGVQQKKVLFVGGHGEHDIDADATDGYRQARQGLETDNYKVDRLDLGTTAKAPDDTAVLVLAGPKKPLLPNELKVIDDYLRQGGKMMILLEPNPQKELQELLRKWGLAFRDGSVVDTLVYAQPDFATPAVLKSQYRLHQITKDLDTTFFPGATGIYFAIPQEDQGKIVPSPLAVTSGSSWLTTAASTTGTPTFSEGKDIPGPVLLAATIEAQAPVGVPAVPGAKDSRIVIIGDSDFASNEYFYSKSNSDLFLNSVNWLGAQEELISIRPKPPQFRRLIITQRGWNWILYSSVGFLPAAVLMAGGVAWWRRR
ncbi:MAG: Gldg family protein [Chloroflexi bacterium]|nr:Gldg family protein [Chloroflexota bacterium]